MSQSAPEREQGLAGLSPEWVQLGQRVALHRRGTTDLQATLKQMDGRRVSVIALDGMAFDLATPGGRMIAAVLAGIAEFELAQERARSGIAAAKARGKRLGRQPGQPLRSDRLAPKLLAPVAQGQGYSPVGRKTGLSKNTGARVTKCNRVAATR